MPHTPSVDEDTSVFLVSCVQAKINPASIVVSTATASSSLVQAKDLYVSPWFRQCRRYVESTNKPWYIMCGQHGLIHPETLIAPYQFSLASLTLKKRQEWGGRLVKSLIATEHLTHGKVVTVFGSETYYIAIFDHLDNAGIVAEQPLESMSMGLQLRWFRDSVGYRNDRDDPNRPRRKYTRKNKPTAS